MIKIMAIEPTEDELVVKLDEDPDEEIKNDCLPAQVDDPDDVADFNVRRRSKTKKDTLQEALVEALEPAHVSPDH